MEDPHQACNNEEVAGYGHGLQIVKYSPYNPWNKLLSPWFDVRVFYVRASGLQMDESESTPEFLTLNHIPLSPDTHFEINGIRSSIYSDGLSSVLRRDRLDKKSDEATFVNTDSLRLSGSMKFEVYDKGQCILSGILAMSDSNGFTGESKTNTKRWSMSCETEVTASSGFFKGKRNPTIEVYVAGCFSGTPIILTKTLQLNFRKKHNRKYLLDVIPEYEPTESQKHVSDDGLHLQVADYKSFKPENEEDYHSMYWQRTGYLEGEDGELSWFNAGVRVGVGIGLGISLGIGLGVGLLVRTTIYKFKGRLI